jgi:hypothetical protein
MTTRNEILKFVKENLHYLKGSCDCGECLRTQRELSDMIGKLVEGCPNLQIHTQASEDMMMGWNGLARNIEAWKLEVLNTEDGNEH